MKAIFTYVKNKNNIGDMSCCPLDYFKFKMKKLSVDTRNFIKEMPDSDLLIVGGGGLMYFDSRYWNRALANAKIAIAWGFGINVHNDIDSNPVTESEIKNRFLFWGIRDWVAGQENPNWVPCVSCMHPKFLENHKIQHEYVRYDHYQYPIEDLNAPNLSNACMDVKKVISFLGSGSTVITTSFHGAYWATLLGRKVIVPNVYSNKFKHLKHQPLIVNKFEKGMEKDARYYPGALTECRITNVQYYNKIIDFLHEVSK